MKQVLAALALAGASLALPAPAHAQQISAAVQNQIRVKFINATRAYEAGNFTEALTRLEEIEDLAGGTRIATAQGLKVKALVELDRWDAARVELTILYNSAPSDGVLVDIAPFADQVDQHFAAIAERERQAALARQREDEAWQSAQASDSEASYRSYLESFPEGRYTAAAQGRLSDLVEQRLAAQAEQERLEWIAATPAYIAEFDETYPRDVRAINARITAWREAISAPQYQASGPVDYENWPELKAKTMQIYAWVNGNLPREVCRERLSSIGWPTDSFCQRSRTEVVNAYNLFIREFNVLNSEYVEITEEVISLADQLVQAKERCEQVKDEPIYAEVEDSCKVILARI